MSVRDAGPRGDGGAPAAARDGAARAQGAARVQGNPRAQGNPRVQGTALPSLPLARGRAAPPCETQPCSQCCHDIEMILTDADVERIAAALGDDAPDNWFFVADDGYLQLRTRDGPPARGSPGGRPCVMLGDDGRCTIWEARPEGCRLYPAVWDDDTRQAELDTDYCPHTDGFALPRALHDATRRLARKLEQERDARAQR